MTEKLTKQKHEYLRQLISETILFRIPTSQAINYIEDKLNTKISESYFYDMRNKVIAESRDPLPYYKDNDSIILLEQFQKRINEMETYKAKAWELLQNTNDMKLQLETLTMLSDLTINLHSLYELLPDYIGLVNSRNDKDKRSLMPMAMGKHPGEYSEEALF